ncbi:MAG: DnaD domain protein [Eubacteriaceae bacterium]|nr:DnaD domain protein [Eubacteriaceae bacterium]
MNHFEFNAQSDDIRTTTVENAFLTHYMPQARGDYVKVYLYGLKCCTLGQSFSDDDIAAALDLSVSDVKKAWKYWEGQDAVRITSSSDDETSLEFMSLASKLYVPSMTPPPAEKPRQKSRGRKYVEMFRDLEARMGRPMAHEEQQTVLFWTDEYKFSTQTVVLMVEDCISRGKNSFNYWNTMADVYHDMGITTYDGLSDYIEKRDADNRRNKEVLKEMGRYDLPTKPERDLMDKWFDSWGMDMETVKKAVAETTNTRKATFSYVDKVLTAWHEGKSTPSFLSSSPKGSSKDRSMPDLEAEYDPDLLDKLFNSGEDE